jgi:hypothetical protein
MRDVMAPWIFSFSQLRPQLILCLEPKFISYQGGAGKHIINGFKLSIEMQAITWAPIILSCC